MERLKNTIGIVLILTITSFTFSCKTSKGVIKGPEAEDFDRFYDRFHQDMDFQMSRIVFPLEGSSEDASGTRTWTKENWIPMKVKIYDVDTSVYKTTYDKTDDTFVQRFWLPGSGFQAEYRFKRIDGQWFLVYAFDTNLYRESNLKFC